MTYDHGSVQLGERCHAWLQPDGGWGWSNAGLVRGDGASLLVDTLFDVPLTRAMLDGFAPLTRSAPIGTVVNTHGNGDHWFGNQLLAGAEIVASSKAAAEMRAAGPDRLQGLLGAAGELGRFAREIFGAFDFAGVDPCYPTTTFDGGLALDVGGVRVELIEVGPAHTDGDVVVWVPDARTVFTGDILFIGGTPIVWAGPIANWLRACERILDLDPAVVVPGHGPVTDRAGVAGVMDYLAFVDREARLRHGAGLPVWDAARDIDLGRFASLGERGRLAANVAAVYRQLDPGLTVSVADIFTRMAELEHAR